MTLLMDLSMRSSIMLLLGLALEAVLAHRSAALRHWVLATALFAAAAVVPLTLLLPAMEISMPAPNTPVPQALPAVSAVSPGGSSPGRPGKRRDAVLSFFTVVWAAGVMAGAAVTLSAIRRLIRIGSRAERVQDPLWTSTTARVAASYGLTREVVILQTGTSDLLATWGWLHPRVLLPWHATDWQEDRIHAVLCHELAHIKRHDWLVQIGAEWLRTVCWFNPLMWIVCTHLRRTSEQACDDAVLDRGVSAREYAVHLLEVARRCRPGSAWASAVPMVRPSTLERRIAAMLNPGLNRKTPSYRAIGATAVLLVAIAVPTAALRTGQTAPASLSGSVYDTSGAVLPGVALTLEDASQKKWQATTDAAGRFDFAGIQPGRYVLAASLAGFRPLSHEFELQNSRDWDRAITLQVGELQETIHVRGQRVAPRQPSQPQGAKPIRVGGNIRVPTKEVDVRPTYPPTMRDAGREGVVPLEAIIGHDGTVTFVRVLSAQVHPDFAIAAVDAVRQWKFSPTLLNGMPVEVVMTVSVRFDLAD